MKNKELALKISKHPLMEKVTKLENKRVVARLVVEELLKENNEISQEDIKKIKEEIKSVLFDINDNTIKYAADGKRIDVYKVYDNTGKKILGSFNNNVRIYEVKGTKLAPEMFIPSYVFINANMQLRLYIPTEIANNILQKLIKGEDNIEIVSYILKPEPDNKFALTEKQAKIILKKPVQQGKNIEQQTLNKIIKDMKKAKMFFSIAGKELVKAENITIVRENESVFYQINSSKYGQIKLNAKGTGLETFLEDWPKSEYMEKTRAEARNGKSYDIAILNDYKRFSGIVIGDEKIYVHQEITGEEEKGEESDPEETEEQKVASEAVDLVNDSLTEFLKFLSNEITGGAEVPGSEESEAQTLQESFFDQYVEIYKAYERFGPEKAQKTFFNLLSKYLKTANVGIDLDANDIQGIWEKWISEKNAREKSKKIIAAYTFHWKNFFKKPDLTGDKIKQAAKKLVAGPKGKLNKFIEKVVNIALYLGLKEGPWGQTIFHQPPHDEAPEDFDFEKESGYKFPFKTLVEEALSYAVNAETKEKLKINSEFMEPSLDLLTEKLKEKHGTMFLQTQDKIFEKIAEPINDGDIEEIGGVSVGDGSYEHIKEQLKILRDDIDKFFKEFSDKEIIEKHIDYLLKEKKDEKRIKIFIYKFIKNPNKKEDFNEIKNLLRKIAKIMKKDKEKFKIKQMNESLSNLADFFETDENTFMSIYDQDEELRDGSAKIDKFFSRSDNIDYFMKYFFGQGLKGPDEKEEEEKFTYSTMVLKALNNQSKKRKQELKTYFKLINKKIENIKIKDKKPQLKKYQNLKNELVFLYSKIIKYSTIVKEFLDIQSRDSEYRLAQKEKQINVYDDILEIFGERGFKDYDLAGLVSWADDPDHIIQYSDRTLEAKDVYLKDLQSWDNLQAGKEKAKAFLYDFRVLVREKEDGEIKQYLDRVTQIDDEIRTGKEQEPEDEEANAVISRELYEFFMKEMKPILQQLQNSPVTFNQDDSKMNFGDPQAGKPIEVFIEFAMNIYRGEFSKSELFKYIGEPKEKEDAKKKILETIKHFETIKLDKEQKMADDQQTYEYFLEEVKDNLLYFTVGRPLFNISKGQIKIQSPYNDPSAFPFQQTIDDQSEVFEDIIRIRAMKNNPNAKKAIKSKYLKNSDARNKLIDNLNLLTIQRNNEIKRDCENIYKKQNMKEKDYKVATRKRNDRPGITPENRYDRTEWIKVKELIEEKINTLYENIKDLQLVNIEDKSQYKEFLETYQRILKIADSQGQGKDYTNNQLKLQENITKIIKPLIREKLKRKQNG